MLYRRRLKCFAALLIFVSISSAIYLIYTSLNPNFDDSDDYGVDFQQVEIPKSTTVRDFIDPDMHFIAHVASDSASNDIITKTPKEGWKFIKIYHGSTDLNKTNCVPFKTLKGNTPICIYPQTEDKMISSYIKDYGTWEPDLLNATAEILISEPKLWFIDLGCNIGPYTLFVSKLGRKVIALDALKTNLDLLHKSLNLGNVHQNVTLVLNALSDRNEDVMVNVVRGNIGGSYIGAVDQKRHSDAVVKAITFDDLLEVVPRKEKVFIKMDIEGNEGKALSRARNFFQSVDVRYLLMEWMLHRRSASGKSIMEFLVGNGMLPYSLEDGNKSLLEYHGLWPDNVLWIKR